MEYKEGSLMIFDSPKYNKAIIAITLDDKFIYSYEGIANCLLEQNICETYEEAIEFIDFNIIPSSYYYPIIIAYDRDSEDFESTMTEWGIEL